MKSVTKPYFSIILPVHNGADYIKECVNGVLNQSFQNFEMIILENASSDGTIEYIQQITDPRVIIYSSEKLLTIEENWARIISTKKSGKYLTLIGHDDILLPNFLQSIIDLESLHPDAKLYLTQFELIDEHGSLIRQCNPIPERESASEFLRTRIDFSRDSFGTGYVMRTEDYDSMGGILPENNLLYSDDLLWLKIIGPKGYLACSRETCFQYRLHTSSTSGTPNQTKLFLGFLTYINYVKIARKHDPKISEIINSKLFNDFCKKMSKNFWIYFYRAPYKQKSKMFLEIMSYFIKRIVV